jgi:undecaprenyl pyrophosphate phosphatase UppP
MKKGVTWPIVALVAVAVAGFVVLYIAVPADDPIRAVLITTFNAIVGGIVLVAANRRSTAVEDKVDKVIEQTNGHTNGHTSTGQTSTDGAPRS